MQAQMEGGGGGGGRRGGGGRWGGGRGGGERCRVKSHHQRRGICGGGTGGPDLTPEQLLQQLSRELPSRILIVNSYVYSLHVVLQIRS